MSDKPISFRLTPSLVERLRDFAQPEDFDESGECRVNLIAKRLLCELLGESTEMSTDKARVSTPSRIVDSSVDSNVNSVDILSLEAKFDAKLESLRTELLGELKA